MSFFENPQRQAAILVIVLGLAVVIGLAPFATGLIGAPVLYVIFAPFYRWLCRRLKPSAAAMTVVLVGLLVIVVPIVGMVILVANETSTLMETVLDSSLLDKLKNFQIGPFRVGAELQQTGSQGVEWISANALNVLGGVTLTTLNLLFAFFGLFFLIRAPDTAWQAVRPYIPFSDAHTERLQERFRAVTFSTLIGTGLAAITQGILMTLGFLAAGIPNAWFWGAVTMIFGILPVVGSGIVFLPAAAWLFVSDRPLAALLLALWGFVVIANVDNLIWPIVYRKYAAIHPLVTLFGAIAGMSYFGLLGLLLGPLTLSYFFELVWMYQDEYGNAEARQAAEAESPPETEKKDG